MSLGFLISGADGSKSLLPKSINTLKDFPLDGLQALYMCQNGTVGQAVTGLIPDETSNAHHGVLLAGSALTRVAGGYHTAGDPANSTATGGANAAGFMFDTGVPVAGSFTVIFTAKLDAGNPDEVYPIPWGVNGGATLPLANYLQLMINTSQPTNIAPRLLTVHPFSDATTQKNFTFIAAITSRFTQAINLDASTGTFTFLLGTTNFSFVDKAYSDWLIAQGFTHKFGYTRYANNAAQADGEFNLGAIYSGSRDVAAMTTLMANARAKVVARGVSPSV